MKVKWWWWIGLDGEMVVVETLRNGGGEEVAKVKWWWWGGCEGKMVVVRRTYWTILLATSSRDCIGNISKPSIFCMFFTAAFIT